MQSEQQNVLFKNKNKKKQFLNKLTKIYFHNFDPTQWAIIYKSLDLSRPINISDVHNRGARAIYPGGAHAPPLLRVGARRGTALEQLQMPIGKILALFDQHCRNFASWLILYLLLERYQWVITRIVLNLDLTVCIVLRKNNLLLAPLPGI